MSHSLQKQILTAAQVEQKIRRIAFEVYENHFDEQSVVLVGIAEQGYRFANRLADQVRAISGLQVEVAQLSLDKTNPTLQSVSFDRSIAHFQDRCIVVCDDVQYTGRILAYSLSPFFQLIPKKLQVAVMVDRGYRRYPIAADYIGYALSTTLSEHVEVILDGENAGVYLS